MPLVLAITILCAVLLLRVGQNARIQGDAAVAMISVGALAIGYLMMNLFPTSGNISGDVCTTLFGSTSILTLTPMEVWLCAALSVTVCSAVLSVCCAVPGILISIVGGTPVGSTIVAVDIMAFAVFSLAGKLLGGVAR